MGPYMVADYGQQGYGYQLPMPGSLFSQLRVKPQEYCRRAPSEYIGLARCMSFTATARL